eukprot:m.186229 g.186229  ORF g.186229 m.186229 type:complete len:475 (+) comp32259_c2_seq2:345-1769(+)
MAANDPPRNPNHISVAFRRKSTPLFPAPDALDQMLDDFDVKTQPAVHVPTYVQLQDIPLIQDATHTAREALFIRKLQQCETKCDFSHVHSDLQNKEVKRNALLDIKMSLGVPEFLSPPIVIAFLKMLGANLFRDWSGPVNPSAPEFDSEEDTPIPTKEWPHFELIYEAFTVFLERSYFKLAWAPHCFDRQIVNGLIDLFNSQDKRERDYAKKTLHRLYSKCVPHRAYIRTTMSSSLCSYLHDSNVSKSFGVAELLEIFGSIIHGFSTPIKLEHVRFLTEILIPLHASPTLAQYHQQLVYCILQFISKDASLVAAVIHGLLRYWPKCNSTKEVMFLNEIDELIDVMEPSTFDELTPIIFKRVGKCCKSIHFQVAERSMYFFNNTKMIEQIETHHVELIPVLVPTLLHQQKSHWSPNVKVLATNVMVLLTQSSVGKIIKEFLSQSRKRKRDEADSATSRSLKWSRILEMAENGVAG